jgi:hypothetical protein
MKALKHTASAILSGMSSTTDILGVFFLNETDGILGRSDLEAMQSDWVAVGNDLKAAMKGYVEKTQAVGADR